MRVRLHSTAAALALLLAVPAVAQEQAGPTGPPSKEDLSRFEDPEGMPAEAQTLARILDRSGSQLPLDATFDTSDGEKVRFGDLLKSGRPVLLQFVYYRCPSLCTITLDGMVDLLRDITLAAGSDFDVITVSINPQETANLARLKKENYLEVLGKPEAAKGWHFLSGSRAQIQALAGAAGFGYRFDTATGEYAHGAGIFVVTPEGKVSRSLLGAGWDPGTVRLSLVEAADGRIGSPMDQILLYCYHFDSRTGQYTAAVMNIVRATSLITALILGGTILMLFRQERRARAAALAETGEAADNAREDMNHETPTPETAGQPEPAGANPGGAS